MIPPGEKPYDAVKDQVADDWKQDQRRRFQDQAATAMMTAVQGGKSFSDAATVAGVTPKLSPLVTRNQGSQDIPPDLQRIMFGLKLHEATMVADRGRFRRGATGRDREAGCGGRQAGYDQARAAIAKSISDDMATVFVDALRQRANPRINQQGFDSVVQAQ